MKWYLGNQGASLLPSLSNSLFPNFLPCVLSILFPFPLTLTFFLCSDSVTEWDRILPRWMWRRLIWYNIPTFRRKPAYVVKTYSYLLSLPTLTMEASGPSGTSVTFYHTRISHIPKYSNIYPYLGGCALGAEQLQLSSQLFNLAMIFRLLFYILLHK